MEKAGKAAAWTGRVLSTLAVLPFILSSAAKFAGAPQVVQGFEHFGWPATSVTTVAVLEITSALLYAIPPLSVFGAIVLTGFLGGAVATHLRIGEPVYLHFVLGFFVWMGLFLREPRLRGLIPIRGKDCALTREILIDRPAAQVFAYLSQLRNFQNWNPFLSQDPQVKLEYSGTDGKPGASVTWEGNKQVGAGEQEITRVTEGRRVDFDLRFKRPYEANNTGYFSVEPAGEGKTKVTWGMQGKTAFPFTLIHLFISLDKMVGGQFEKGLNQLKSILEK